MPYTDYSVMDFVMDERFQRWVLHPEPSDHSFWNQWLSQHPEKKAAIEEAARLLLLQQYPIAPWPAHRMQKVKENIQQSPPDAVPSASQKFSIKHSYRVAAAVLILAAAVMVFRYKSIQTTTYQTAYGQTKAFSLPDSSSVLLNANSSLRYSRHWNTDKPREVWLEGEAFFKVRKWHTPAQQTDASAPVKFIVHVEGLDVEVMGTEFNVQYRHSTVQVVLNEGKIDVKVEDGERVVMRPGDMLQYSLETNQLVHQQVDTDKQTSWRNHLLVFDNQTLAEVGRVIEDYYGVQVVFSHAALAQEKITGTLPSDNLEVILQSLETIYQIRIDQQKEKIIMDK